MNQTITEDQHFKGIDYTDAILPKGAYEYCTFVDCVFSNSNLSEMTFVECSFENCDFSMAKINDTTFREAQFKGCKLLGLRFEDCNEFLLSFDFADCTLNFSSFNKLSLKGIIFKNCTLHEVDFSETNLSEAIFENCDLSGTVFNYTKLEKADFSTSLHFSIDPETNHVKKAKFSLDGVVGLLDKYGIVVV